MYSIRPTIAKVTLLFILLLPMTSMASSSVPQQWQIDYDKSTLQFTANHISGPIQGSFNKFKADISFDPTQLDKSIIVITVDMTSVFSEFAEALDNLPQTTWFNVQQFPQAVFASKHIILSDNKYVAEGTLTIRNNTHPISLEFTLDIAEADTSAPLDEMIFATAKGSTSINRRDFNIGWKATDEVANEVRIDFSVYATQKR